MDLGLAGKVGIITGASAGIGRAIAVALADEGMKLVLVARRGALLEQVAADLATPARTVEVDLISPDAVGRVLAEARNVAGAVDVLVNAAGGSRPLPIDASDDRWAEAFDLNFSAVRRLAHGVLPAMLAGGWGRILTITGSSEPKPMPLVEAPSILSSINAANAAKAAVHAWSKGLSREVGPRGITVNCVAPGRVMSEQIAERFHPSASEREVFAAQNIPMGRFGEAREVADLVAFLASPRAEYITGEIVHVDGGMRRHAF
jgi:3-oxoacyl-[acyl-carrier protein] reductase